MDRNLQKQKMDIYIFLKSRDVFYCLEYKNIIFCWVMQEQSILDDVLSRLNKHNCILYKFSMVCSEKSLISRITKDIKQGIRNKDVVERSLPRLKNYFEMDTKKIDVSEISAKEAAARLYELIKD